MLVVRGLWEHKTQLNLVLMMTRELLPLLTVAERMSGMFVQLYACMTVDTIASYIVMLLDKGGIEHSQSVKMFLSKPGMQQYLYTLLSTLQLGRVYLDIWVKWVTFSLGHASRRVKLKNPSLRYSLI